MSKPKGLSNKVINIIFAVIAVAVVISLIARNMQAFVNILKVLIGFGAVIMIHEFGHFIVAKLSGIKVEAFSIGFPPTLAGVLRTEKGYRIRFLPGLAEGDKEDEGSTESEKCKWSITLGKKAKPGETEYRFGAIPFGGFVKMLGQDDTKAVTESDDPRSYVNKPVGIRMAVIAAGVIFNAISAMIIFMIVFSIGIRQMPPVVGDVRADSPAQRAGLQAGDEIIRIDGKSADLSFRSIMMAAALSGRGEQVEMTVKRRDGTIEDIGIVAEEMDLEMGVGRLRLFGLMPAQSLTIAQVIDRDVLEEQTGLLPGDRIVSVNNKDVEAYWQLEEIIEEASLPQVPLLAERQDADGTIELVETSIDIDLSKAQGGEVTEDSQLHHIYSMIPRLRITYVVEGAQAKEQEAQGDSQTSDIILAKGGLQIGDIIVAIGGIGNPTYRQMREVTTDHNGRELELKVLRSVDGSEQIAAVTVVPYSPKGIDRVMIGVGVALDAEHPVIAQTLRFEGGPAALAIPAGAMITAVDGAEVGSFYDIIKQIRGNAGQRIMIDYRVDDETAGTVALQVDRIDEFITAKPKFSLPVEELKRLYKADGPSQAVVMGCRRAVGFILEAYITLQRALTGLVSPKNFMGPVGILTTSYRIAAERPLIEYVSFLGLISTFIAVFNFLPLLPFDGGHIVLLLIEKVKGSAVSERVQTAMMYVGMSLVGALVIYVTFNDVVRSFFQ